MNRRKFFTQSLFFGGIVTGIPSLSLSSSNKAFYKKAWQTGRAERVKKAMLLILCSIYAALAPAQNITHQETSY
ncbi:MAG: hypothetical protein ACQER7_14620, partial [Bacteroidota bacterium]